MDNYSTNSRRTSSISGSSSVPGILRPTLLGNTSSSFLPNPLISSSTGILNSGSSTNNRFLSSSPLTFNTPIGILTSNELLTLLHESLPIRDIRSSLVLYRNVFTSQDFIDTIITKGLVHNGDMFSALAFGNSLISNNLLIHAKDPRQPFKAKVSSLYRLTIHGGSGPKGTEIVLPPKPLSTSNNSKNSTMITVGNPSSSSSSSLSSLPNNSTASNGNNTVDNRVSTKSPRLTSVSFSGNETSTDNVSKKPNRTISFSDLSLPSSSPPSQNLNTNTTSSPSDTASLTDLYPYPPMVSSSFTGTDDHHQSSSSPLRRSSIASTATFLFPNISPYSQGSTITDLNTFNNSLLRDNSPVRERIHGSALTAQENIPPLRTAFSGNTNTTNSYPKSSLSSPVNNMNTVPRINVSTTTSTGTNTTPILKHSTSTPKENSPLPVSAGSLPFSLSSPKASLSTVETLNLSVEQLKQQMEILRMKQEMYDNRSVPVYTPPDTESSESNRNAVMIDSIIQRFETLLEKNNTEIRYSMHQLVSTLNERLSSIENRANEMDHRIAHLPNVDMDTIEAKLKEYTTTAQENLGGPTINQQLETLAQRIQILNDKYNVDNNSSTTSATSGMVVRQRNSVVANNNDTSSTVSSNTLSSSSVSWMSFLNHVSSFLTNLDTNTIALGIIIAITTYSFISAQSILDFFRIFILITLCLLFIIVFLPIILYYLRTSPIIMNYTTKLRQFMDTHTGKHPSSSSVAKIRNM